MGKALAVACLALAACQPMYQHKPERLKNPPGQTPKGGVATTAGEPTPVFVEDCTVNFSAPPAKKRKEQASQTETAAGNTALPASSARPATPAGVQSVTTAIAHYRQALIDDPYNAEATLQLALAYDRVLRKGCALAMLRRLDALAANPTFQPDAEPMVELVVQNPHWFRPYHNDAVKAAGR